VNSSSKDIKLRAGILIGLALLTILAFLPVFQNNFINYDDPGYVYHNDQVSSGLSVATLRWAFTSTAQSNWHPLTWLSHALDCTLFGLNPAGHHAMNLFIHVLSALLLFLVFEELTGSCWPSAFVALIFALHPLHVESVAWISERKDTLSTLFWILTMGAYGRYARTRSRSWYAAVLGAFFLGLLSKPMLVTLPFVLVLLDYWPLRRISLGRTAGPGDKISFGRSLIEKIPLFILSILSSIITYIVQQTAGSVASSADLPVLVRMGTALVSYVVYIYKTIVPFNLSIFYPHTGMQAPAWQIAGAVILLGGITWLVWQGRAHRPFLVTGWFWYVGTLVPVIGFVQVGLQSMADRYMYVPMIGLSIIAGWGIPLIFRENKFSRRLPALGAAVLALALCYAAYTEAGYWKDSETLFRRAVSVTERNHLALNNLGAALADSGRHAEALIALNEALRIMPDQELIHRNIARSLAALGRQEEALVHYRWLLERRPATSPLLERMGDCLMETGREAEAIGKYTDALRLDKMNVLLHCKIADAYARMNKFDDAVRECHVVLAADSASAGAYRILGIVAASTGSADSAEMYLLHALRCAPADGESQNLLGLLYERRGKLADAIAMYRAAVQNRPDLWNARFNLGTLLAQRGDMAGAESQLLRAAELRPASADVFANLGRVFFMERKEPEARRTLERAIALDSTHVNAHYNLGLLFVNQRQADLARAEFERALRLSPGFLPARNALQRLKAGQ
jgi:tetratricopeptide (TPR) repeat protein